MVIISESQIRTMSDTLSWGSIEFSEIGVFFRIGHQSADDLRDTQSD